jgi:hypothetical protein
MKDTFFTIAQLGFLTLSLICIFLIVKGIQFGIKKGNYSSTWISKFVIIITLWILLVSILSLVGISQKFELFPFNIAPFLLPPLILSIWLSFFYKPFHEFLKQIPHSWILYLQFFRVPVEIFLWMLYENNSIPIQMTFEGRNLDILTGLTAPLAVWLFIKEGKEHKWALVIWNLLGIGLLINIVGTAILSMPTPFRVFMNEPANVIVTHFPFIFLPTILVPLAYYLHFFSLKKLLSK